MEDETNNNLERLSKTSHTFKGTKFEELKNLLTDEPQIIKENVMREWMQLDAQMNILVKSIKDENLDESFEKLNLEPDEFENEITVFLEKLRWTEPIQDKMNI